MKKRKIELGKKLILDKENILSFSVQGTIAGGATGNSCNTYNGAICGECQITNFDSCKCLPVTLQGDLTCSPGCSQITACAQLTTPPASGCAGTYTNCGQYYGPLKP